MSLRIDTVRPAGFTGAPHERNTSGDRAWTVWDVAKYTHPGVEVLPGEPKSKWREVVGKWIGYIPQWSGLKEGFKTDYIECHTVAPRELWNDTLQKTLEETLKVFLLPGEDATLNTSQGEFFDELTYRLILIGFPLLLRRADRLLERGHPGGGEDRPDRLLRRA